MVVDEAPVPSEAAVVLFTGVDWYPRLMEAAELYKQGFAKKVVINGNRKTEVLKDLEARGFQRCCPWEENGLRILELLGVPREDVMAVGAEDAYDTISEARAVGRALTEAGVTRIILTTSRYHTRRARYIWKRVYPKRFRICTKAAHEDPFSPRGWWKDGRQIRSVLAEYGAWAYFLWKAWGPGLSST